METGHIMDPVRKVNYLPNLNNRTHMTIQYKTLLKVIANFF